MYPKYAPCDSPVSESCRPTLPLATFLLELFLMFTTTSTYCARTSSRFTLLLFSLFGFISNSRDIASDMSTSFFYCGQHAVELTGGAHQFSIQSADIAILEGCATTARVKY